MKKSAIIILVIASAFVWGCVQKTVKAPSVPDEVSLTKEQLMDKITSPSTVSAQPWKR